MSNDPKRVLELIRSWQADESQENTARLFEALYDDFRRIGVRVLLNRGGRRDGTFSPSDLVQETYSNLLGIEDKSKFSINDEAHFMAFVARVMGRIVKDHGRAKAAQKRGGGLERQSLSELEGVDASAVKVEERQSSETEVSIAIAALWEEDEDVADVFVLRHFGDLSQDEVVQRLGVAKSTVARRWKKAKEFLHSQLN